MFDLKRQDRRFMLSALTAWALTPWAQAADDHSHHKAPEKASEADPHAHHNHAAMGTEVKRSTENIKLPPTTLVRQDGTIVTLTKELDGSKPVILAFIYTSCTTICPVTSQILSQTQGLLGSDIENIRLVSISIDPEYDTPQRLLEYSKKFGAKPQWQHYTGTRANSIAVQRAFNAYRGDKMNHVPLVFVNGGGKKPWIRLEGFPTAEQLLHEYHAQAHG